MRSKTKRRSRKGFLSVQAVYPGGVNGELDAQLTKVAGRDSDGSGCFLIGARERDHSWYFELDQQAEAEKLAGRLRPLPVTVEVARIST